MHKNIPYPHIDVKCREDLKFQPKGRPNEKAPVKRPGWRPWRRPEISSGDGKDFETGYRSQK
jgi:hypothetical protein